jgi:uncharacterized membrane protein
MQHMRKEMEGLTRKDRIWMKSMHFCGKYCGCHQMPDRSFFIGDYQLPLCARCTGIVIGHVLGIILSIARPVPWMTIFGTIPLMIDGTVQKFTDYESTNPRRICTGILYGFGVMTALISCGKMLAGKVFHK